MVLLHQLKIRADGGWVLTALLDLCLARGTEVGGHGQIFDFGRVDAHNAAAGGVDGDEVFAENQDVGCLRSSLDGSVPFHPDDAIDDRESLAKLAIYGDDGFGDSDVVEGVFRPAVNGTGDEAEEVFHRKGGAGPVMGLHFRHGDDEIGRENRVGKEELVLAREVFNGTNVVTVEVDEIIFEVPDTFPIAGLVGEAEGIAAVAGTFGDGDRGGPERAEGVEGGRDEGDISIDGGGRVELDQVRFQDDPFIFNLEPAEEDTGEDMGDEIFLVAFRFEHGDG